jgi:hypothetical protein
MVAADIMWQGRAAVNMASSHLRRKDEVKYLPLYSFQQMLHPHQFRTGSNGRNAHSKHPMQIYILTCK